jgi:Holliday junction resolvase RusA-like endonuclease
MSTTITLPMAPSVNSLWRSARGRVWKSRRYVAWLKESGWTLKLQKPKRITGPVAVTVAAGKPDKRRRDLDNIATKAVLDLLTQMAVIEDDRFVVKLSAAWDEAVPAGTVRVTITSAGADALAAVN